MTNSPAERTTRSRGRRAEGNDPIARHGSLRTRGPARTIITWVAIGLAVVLVSAVSIVGISVGLLAHNIKTVKISGETSQSIDKIKGGFNILIVGSDACTTHCAGYGKRDAALNDVTILLHVSEDQTNAVAVSFPRDLVVPIPACTREDGSGTNSAMAAQPINTTLGDGGLNCVAATVTQLTGLDIQFAGLVTFTGVIRMTDAVGGVPVCLSGNLVDPRTGLDLKKGTVVLKGKEALQFLRTRHGVGDGSDLTRISSQQVYMSSLVRTLKSKDTLSNPKKVLAIATAATQNMQLSENFANVQTLASIALALKDIPLDNVTFVQYPATTGIGGVYSGKAAPLKEQADKLFSLIKSDTPFTLAKAGDGVGSELNPSSTSTPTPTATKTPTQASGSTPTPTATSTAPAVEDLRGQKASDDTCTITR